MMAGYKWAWGKTLDKEVKKAGEGESLLKRAKMVLNEYSHSCTYIFTFTFLIYYKNALLRYNNAAVTFLRTKSTFTFLFLLSPLKQLFSSLLVFCCTTYISATVFLLAGVIKKEICWRYIYTFGYGRFWSKYCGRHRPRDKNNSKGGRNNAPFTAAKSTSAWAISPMKYILLFPLRIDFRGCQWLGKKTDASFLSSESKEEKSCEPEQISWFSSEFSSRRFFCRFFIPTLHLRSSSLNDHILAYNC